MIKAIVMDMDGTLLNSSNQIPEKTARKLRELEKQGIRLVLASGRSYTRLMPYAKQLEMDQHGGFLLEVDGIATYDLAADKRCKRREMEPEEIREIFNWLTQQEAESMACYDDGLFDFFPESYRKRKEILRKEQNVPEDYPWTAGPWSILSDLRDGYPHISYIQSADEIDRKVNKIQIMLDEDKIQNLFDRLQEKYSDRFEIFRTTPKQLEILPKGFSKGKTLARMMDENGWMRDEVLVFGDGENDVSMFEAVKDSYAMGNAQDFIKQQAAHTTASNNEEGILQALEKLGC